MSVMCSAIQAALPTVGESAINGPLAAHVETCVPCRGELVRYRTMYRELDALNRVRHRAPQGLVAAVTGDLGPVAVEDIDTKMDPRVSVTAAAVVATAAAGTAVLYKLYRDHAA